MTGCKELIFKTFFLTFNTHVLGEFRKRKDVFDFLRKQKGNVFLLQETHWPSGIDNIVSSQWGCKCVVAGHDWKQKCSNSL